MSYNGPRGGYGPPNQTPYQSPAAHGYPAQQPSPLYGPPVHYGQHQQFGQPQQHAQSQQHAQPHQYGQQHHAPPQQYGAPHHHQAPPPHHAPAQHHGPMQPSHRFHPYAQNPSFPEKSGEKPSSEECYNCGSPEHIAQHCLEPRRAIPHGDMKRQKRHRPNYQPQTGPIAAPFPAQPPYQGHAQLPQSPYGPPTPVTAYPHSAGPHWPQTSQSPHMPYGPHSAQSPHAKASFSAPTTPYGPPYSTPTNQYGPPPFVGPIRHHNTHHNSSQALPYISPHAISQYGPSQRHHNIHYSPPETPVAYNNSNRSHYPAARPYREVHHSQDIRQIEDDSDDLKFLVDCYDAEVPIVFRPFSAAAQPLGATMNQTDSSERVGQHATDETASSTAEDSLLPANERSDWHHAKDDPAFRTITEGSLIPFSELVAFRRDYGADVADDMGLDMITHRAKLEASKRDARITPKGADITSRAIDIDRGFNETTEQKLLRLGVTGPAKPIVPRYPAGSSQHQSQPYVDSREASQRPRSRSPARTETTLAHESGTYRLREPIGPRDDRQSTRNQSESMDRRTSGSRTKSHPYGYDGHVEHEVSPPQRSSSFAETVDGINGNAEHANSAYHLDGARRSSSPAPTTDRRTSKDRDERTRLEREEPQRQVDEVMDRKNAKKRQPKVADVYSRRW